MIHLRVELTVLTNCGVICSCLQFLFKIFGLHDFLPSNEIMRWLADIVCQPEDLKTICSNIIFIIDGYDKANLNQVNREK